VAVACRPAVERPPPERPVSERPALDLARFENEIRAFEAADRTTMPDTGGVLFVGSSSMRLWPDVARDFPGVPVINRGFGGSTVAEVVNYARRIVVPYRPRLIVLYAGDNDLQMGLEPREVLTDYRRFVHVVRHELPRTRIAYVSVKPSPSRWALADAMRETNALIRAETERDSLQTFVDIFTPMLGANGRPRPELYVADSLHMTPAGYALWRERLAPVLRRSELRRAQRAPAPGAQ
jgi:lysophospholipase L1-like esterase